MEWIYSLENLRDREFNSNEKKSCKDGSMWPWVHYMCPPIHGEGLKNIFNMIEWVGNTGNILYITPHPSYSVLTCVEQAFLFSSGVQEATRYLLFLKIENS